MIKHFKCIYAVLALLGLSPQINAAIFDLTITADNSYAFGFGDENSIALGGLSTHVDNSPPGAIFGANGPETYIGISSTNFSHVYIAAWADDATAQGVLAGFSSADATNLNSAENWEVFATGDLASGQSILDNAAVINTQIGLANSTSGAAGGSLGWVNIYGQNTRSNKAVVGKVIEDTADTLYTGAVSRPGGFVPEFNDQFNSSASWMWYDNGSNANPFKYSAASDGGWLLFRAAIPLTGVPSAVPIPSAVWLFGSGLLGLIGIARSKRI